MKAKLLLAIFMFATMRVNATPLQEITAANDSTETAAPAEKHYEDFSNVSLTYLAWFDNFDKGFYGLRYESIDRGIYTLSFKGSWGITDPGFYQWRIGFGPAGTLTQNVAYVCPVSFMMGDYLKNIKFKSNGDIDYEKDLHYGLVLSPGLRAKLGVLMIGVSFDLGFDYADKFRFYKGFELGLGVKI